MPVADLTVTLDQRSFDLAVKRLARYDLKSPTNAKRIRRVYLEGARMLVAPMRREAPVGPTGNLRRSIAARSPRLRIGEMAAASVGPRGGRSKGAHRWFVVDGTKRHSLAPVRKGPWVVIPEGGAPVGGIGPRRGHVYPGSAVMHPGQQGNPFVDRVTQRYGGHVQDWINGQVLTSGETFMGTF